MVNRPALHFCSWWCRVLCVFGHHTRQIEGKCRCCRRFSVTTAHELARRREYPKLTTGWWKGNEGKVA